MKPIEKAPDWVAAFKNPETLSRIFESSQDVEVLDQIAIANDEYLYWDSFKHKYKPNKVSAAQAWALLKLTRNTKLKRIGLKDVSGKSFGYWLPDSFLKSLHLLDQNASGSLLVDEPEVTSGEKERFIINSLMEEAIASSQLEGAATTRKKAKEMLRSGRTPQSQAEQMILNNYLTMREIKKFVPQPLSPQMIKEIQALITKNTLEDPADAGRFRTAEDKVEVVWDDGTVLHTPPPAEELDERMKRLCEYANTEEEKGFAHPVVKAVILHFWLAYDHPFVDGNGRTARAIFYWYMLKRGYWLTEYLSISRIIKKGPAQYVRAYLYSEIDDADLTYFLGYHLRILDIAWRELNHYLTRKIKEAKEAKMYLVAHPQISYRQSQFLKHAITHPLDVYTIEHYKNTYAVTYETARTDLTGLEKLKFLKRIKKGRQFLYIPAHNLAERLAKTK